MGIRHYKPATPGRRRVGQRLRRITDRKKKPEKSLLEPKPKKGGRNNPGHHHLAVPWRRTQADVPGHRLQAQQGRRAATVISIEYDPEPDGRIALLQYEDGEKAYILAPEGLKAGDKVMSGRGRPSRASATVCRCGEFRWA